MEYTQYAQLPLTLSIQDIQEILGIGKNTAYELIRCNKIYSIRVGRQIRIPKEALMSFLGEK